jgi:hypothetical protein
LYHVAYENKNNLTSWIGEISINGRNWPEVDRQNHNEAELAVDVTQTFELVKKELCQSIRLADVGRNLHGDDCPALAGFEVFGSLIE